MKKYFLLSTFVSVILTSSCVSENLEKETTVVYSEEKNQIIALLEKEVNALNRDHDLEAYLSCFKVADDIVTGPSNDELTVGYEAVKAVAVRVIESYGESENPNSWSFDDWNIRVNGNTAFATCTQTTVTGEGKTLAVFKSDYLEKIAGEWKIVDHRFFHTAPH